MLQDADASKTLAEDKEKCHDIQTHGIDFVTFNLLINALSSPPI